MPHYTDRREFKDVCEELAQQKNQQNRQPANDGMQPLKAGEEEYRPTDNVRFWKIIFD